MYYARAHFLHFTHLLGHFLTTLDLHIQVYDVLFY